MAPGSLQRRFRTGSPPSAQRPPALSRGAPWENGYIESFNARLRDELLDGEIFYTLPEARIIVESWKRIYNTLRPQGSLGYRPPAPEVFLPQTAWAAAPSQPASPPTLAPRPSMHQHATRTTQWGLIKTNRSAAHFNCGKDHLCDLA